jgi:hypothetical protein
MEIFTQYFKIVWRKGITFYLGWQGDVEGETHPREYG